MFIMYAVGAIPVTHWRISIPARLDKSSNFLIHSVRVPRINLPELILSSPIESPPVKIPQRAMTIITIDR